MSYPTWYSCNVCGSQAKNLNRCSKCRSVLYCSSKCQRQDWSQHRNRCSKKDDSKNDTDESVQNNTRSYFVNNQLFTDAPEINRDEPFITITLKYNGTRKKIDLQTSWTSSEMFKYICSIVRIPLDLIKLINKGKIIRSNNLKDFVVEGAIFQVIGELMEDSEGINQKDIELLMKQMKVGYNESVRTLRTNNLVDAILFIGNKETN